MIRHNSIRRSLAFCIVLGVLGCNGAQDLNLGEGRGLYYKRVSTEIEYPTTNLPHSERALDALPPHRLADLKKDKEVAEDWPLSLEECVRIALANSRVIRDLNGRVLAGSNVVNSVYDPALQESDPTFGVEAALSAFDANLVGSLVWGKFDRPQNFFIPGFGVPVRQADTADFQADIVKRIATGGQVAARNVTTYQQDNNPANQFPSVWNTDFEVEFAHPLLQGNGIAFNRIAGPNSIPGSPNGVVLARLNTDISLADFELAVRNFISDVENAYWDLYFAYRDLDAKKKGRDSALELWRNINLRAQVGAAGGDAASEAQARDQYYRFKASVESAIAGQRAGSTNTGVANAGILAGRPGIFAREMNLRFLMGLPANDGRLIRPVEQPTYARLEFDWQRIVTEALTRRVELRRQRWLIRRHELELVAARNFLLPRLDATGLYRWHGFGDDLLAVNNRQPNQFDNAFNVLTNGDFQEWTLGLQLNVPIGYRQAHAAVRNAQLQLSKARATYSDQELEVVHDLGHAWRELDLAYQLTQTYYNSMVAAETKNETLQLRWERGALRQGEDSLALLIDLLQAQRDLADAEIRFHQALASYMLAIKNLQWQKGTLLSYNGIELAEGPWPRQAYRDARELARHFARRHIDYGFTLPHRVSCGRHPQLLEYEGSGEEPAPANLEMPPPRPPRPNDAPAVKPAPPPQLPEPATPKNPPAAEANQEETTLRIRAS